MRGILNRDCIISIEEPLAKKEIVQKMAEVLKKQGYVLDEKTYVSDVWKREEICSTYIGFGIAVPHGKSSAVINNGVCIAKLEHGIVWHPEKQEETKLVILLAVNREDDKNTHMKILSKLCMLLMHEEFREEIMHCSEQELYECLKGRLLDE